MPMLIVTMCVLFIYVKFMCLVTKIMFDYLVFYYISQT